MRSIEVQSVWDFDVVQCRKLGISAGTKPDPTNVDLICPIGDWHSGHARIFSWRPDNCLPQSAGLAAVSGPCTDYLPGFRFKSALLSPTGPTPIQATPRSAEINPKIVNAKPKASTIRIAARAINATRMGRSYAQT
jgi:hypothetical protein